MEIYDQWFTENHSNKGPDVNDLVGGVFSPTTRDHRS
jgi:hypothetical protein